jgi:hypothetical protein
VLQSLKHGQLVPRTLVATAKASSTGAYQMRASAAALSAVAVSNGYANLEIDSGTATWFFPYRTAKASPADSPSDDRAGVPTVDLVSRSRPLTGATRPAYCDWGYMKQLKPAWAIVGQGYVLSRPISQKFAYNSGQNSSLGVGLSPSGTAGSFHADGKLTESSGQTQNFRKHYKGYDWYQTKFRVAKYGWYCGGSGFSAPYQVRSDGYYGAAKDVAPRSRPKYQECGQEPGGQVVTTHRERAVEWSAGFDIAQVGFGASAQTGYDSSAQLSYKYGSRGGYECGTNNEAPAQAPQLVARGP